MAAGGASRRAAGRQPGPWVVIHLVCVLCGAQTAHLELSPPTVRPLSWSRWEALERKRYDELRDPVLWWLVLESELHDNGLGENVTEAQAALLRGAFTHPRRYCRVRAAGLPGHAGFCPDCDVAYCPQHWRSAPGGPARCPCGHPRW